MNRFDTKFGSHFNASATESTIYRHFNRITLDLWTLNKPKRNRIKNRVAHTFITFNGAVLKIRRVENALIFR